MVAVAAIAAVPTTGGARTLRIGAGGDYSRLEDAFRTEVYGPGDTLAVLPGTYAVTSMLRPLGSGSDGAPVVVRGLGASRPVVSGSLLTNSKALWDLEQSNRWWVFEHLEVRDMRGAQTNARGFLIAGSTDLVLRDLEITNCWNGIMTGTGAARLTVEFCDIHDNGGLQGPAHNIYLSGGSDHVVRHNWIHDAHYGMNFKDRTRNLQLLYNRIENADQGGYEVSLAGQGTLDRGRALLLGNVVIKSATSSQQTHCIRFEDGRVGSLDMVNNTVLARSNNVVLSTIASTTTLRNNVFAGGRTLVSTAGVSGAVVQGSHNWVSAGAGVPAGLTDTSTGVAPGFAGEDFDLAADSPCIDAGAAAPEIEWQYAAPAGRAARTVRGAAIDLGAFEFAGESVTDPPPAEDTTPPAAPTEVGAEALDASRVRVGWSAPSDAVEFVIERSTGTEGAWSEVARVAAAPYIDTGLAAATLFRYRIRALDAAENVSAASDIVTATTRSPSEPGTTTLGMLAGTLVSGSGDDLGADDDATAVVRAAGAGRSFTADVYVTSVPAGDGALQVDYDVQSTGAVSFTLYVWRWTHKRWDSVAKGKMAAGTVARGSAAIAALPARYVSATGAVRARLRARGTHAFDLAMDELRAARPVPEGGDDTDDDDNGSDAIVSRTRAIRVEYSPSIGVRFVLDSSAEARVELFDVRGRRIASLIAPRGAAAVRWDGRDARGRRLASSVVFARVMTAQSIHTARFVWRRE